MAHVDRRDQTQINTLAADLSLKPAGLVAAMDSSESGAGGQTPGAGLVAASSESGAAGAGGQTPGAGLVAAMDSSESGAGGQTPGPRGEKRPSEVASEAARDTYCLADYLPEEWLSKGFGPDSIAHHQVVCADLTRRCSAIVAQVLARDVLNQALMTIGETPHDSLGAAIPSSLTHQIVNKHQAKLLWKLNANANEAKHGWWFHGETTTGTAASSS